MRLSNNFKIVFLGLILLRLGFPKEISAQYYQYGYSLPGMVVFNSHDTLKCDIMYVSDAQDCEFIIVKDKTKKQEIRYYPNQVLYYKRGITEFYSVPCKGDFGTMKKVFMRNLIKGTISYYSYHFISGSINYQKEGTRFYMHREDEIAEEVRKYNFSKTLSTYISDCPVLAWQVKSGILKYENLEQIITEYNKWAIEQKGHLQEEKKDSLLPEGNLLDKSNSMKKNGTNSINSSRALNSFKQAKRISYPHLGFDLPLFVSKSFVDVMPQLKDQIKYYKGGTGYDIGAGIRVDFSNRVSLKLGINTWNRIFNINYPAVLISNSGTQTDVVVKEEGVFRYTGGFVKIHYNAGPVFAGAGFNFSFETKYKCDYGVYDINSSVPLFERKNKISSPLVNDNISELFDIVIVAGFRIQGNGGFCIKPAVELSLGAKPTVKTGAWEISIFDGKKNDIDIYTLSLKFGAVVEF